MPRSFKHWTTWQDYTVEAEGFAVLYDRFRISIPVGRNYRSAMHAARRAVNRGSNDDKYTFDIAPDGSISVMFESDGACLTIRKVVQTRP